MTDAEEKLQQRWDKFYESFPEVEDDEDNVILAFFRAELERAAGMVDYSQGTFDDSDDPMGFTRNALGRVAAAIRRRKE